MDDVFLIPSTLNVPILHSFGRSDDLDDIFSMLGNLRGEERAYTPEEHPSQESFAYKLHTIF
jgi:hypothetical protein